MSGFEYSPALPHSECLPFFPLTPNLIRSHVHTLLFSHVPLFPLTYGPVEPHVFARKPLSALGFLMSKGIECFECICRNLKIQGCLIQDTSEEPSPMSIFS